ncbi:TetR/AcrR family transcriptional regulator [Pseudoroseicyclus aestuarii]|uniref:TetR family transcriptional regulator n=1 Tax=Pseudoroseicyclus aestuarii TaxID=1795041 RepID=A0A318SNT0_9RHOB|nr:TetR/AcrR family transcriptional regulator [Pseudoroseicyclus aestuarii]PYE82346.1 TetR family transcriptional regulator [Pseudoroseicyclus aestuarii]
MTDCPCAAPPKDGSRRARTQARLIEAAILVLAEQGPDRTVIDDVITRAEVSRGTFYNYFRSIEEVLAAVQQALGAEILSLVKANMQEVRDPAVRVATAVTLFTEAALHYPLFLEFTARIGHRTRGPGSVLHDAVQMLLQDGFATGRFIPMPAQMMVDVVGGSTIALLQRMQDGDRSERRHFIAALLRLLGLPAEEAWQLAEQPVPEIDLPEESLICRSELVRTAGAGAAP